MGSAIDRARSAENDRNVWSTIIISPTVCSIADVDAWINLASVTDDCPQNPKNLTDEKLMFVVWIRRHNVNSFPHFVESVGAGRASLRFDLLFQMGFCDQ